MRATRRGGGLREHAAQELRREERARLGAVDDALGLQRRLRGIPRLARSRERKPVPGAAPESLADARCDHRAQPGGGCGLQTVYARTGSRQSHHQRLPAIVPISFPDAACADADVEGGARALARKPRRRQLTLAHYEGVGGIAFALLEARRTLPGVRSSCRWKRRS